MIVGLQCRSEFSSLTLATKTCPLGLLTLGKYSGDQDYIVFNEEVSGDAFESIPDLLRGAEAVYLSAHTGNINRSLQMAKRLRGDGIHVYLGGPEPSMMGPRLALDHPYLTGMVIGAADTARVPFLYSLREGKHPQVFPKDLSTDMFEYVPPRTRIDFANVSVDYNQLFELDRHQGVSYLWGNDCAQAHKRCFFCGRISLGVGFRPPKRIWRELGIPYEKGIKFYYNTTDSVTTNLHAFNSFCEAKPKAMKESVHRVFVNANQVSKELIESLHRLNGVAVIGVESFGRIAETGKQKTNVQDNLRAIAMLFNGGIRMVLSFVFGLPGENDKSIRQNEEGIIDLVERYGEMIDAIHMSPLLVTTGSPAWPSVPM